MKVGERFNPFRMFTGAFVPESLCRYRGVSSGAKLVYARLYRFAGERGECFPSVPKVAEEIGVGETQARVYLDELIESKLIEKEGSPGHVNTYFFVWHECYDGVDGEARKSPPIPPRKTEAVENGETPSVNRTADPLGKPDEESQLMRVILKRVILRRRISSYCTAKPRERKNRHPKSGGKLPSGCLRERKPA